MTEPNGMLDYLAEFAKQIAAQPPRPDRLEIGTIAHTIFISAIRSRPPGIYTGPGSMPAMFGVRIVPKSNMLPNAWQLVASDGQVLDCGILTCLHAERVDVTGVGAAVGQRMCVICGDVIEEQRDVWSLYNCRHGLGHHRDGGLGPCTQLDSYEQPCACPSFEEMDDGDDDESHREHDEDRADT